MTWARWRHGLSRFCGRLRCFPRLLNTTGIKWNCTPGLLTWHHYLTSVNHHESLKNDQFLSCLQTHHPRSGWLKQKKKKTTKELRRKQNTVLKAPWSKRFSIPIEAWFIISEMNRSSTKYSRLPNPSTSESIHTSHLAESFTERFFGELPITVRY